MHSSPTSMRILFMTRFLLTRSPPRFRWRRTGAEPDGPRTLGSSWGRVKTSRKTEKGEIAKNAAHSAVSRDAQRSAAPPDGGRKFSPQAHRDSMARVPVMRFPKDPTTTTTLCMDEGNLANRFLRLLQGRTTAFARSDSGGRAALDHRLTAVAPSSLLPPMFCSAERR
jgi:hypothetical protein